MSLFKPILAPEPLERPDRPLIMNLTYYFPWGLFVPVRAGAAATAARHLEYFRNRRIRTRIALLADCSISELHAFRRHYDWVDEVLVISPRRHPRLQRWLDVWSLGTYLAGHAELSELPAFRDFASRPTDVLFSNYVFTAPLADAFDARVVRVMESHDVMSEQFRTREMSAAEYQHNLQVEFELYSLHDLVLMVNPDETRFAKERSTARVEYVARSVDAVDVETSEEEEPNIAYDLLFVGSRHLPNVEGVERFYHHIFAPFLKHQGLRFAIAGSVGEALSLADPEVEILGAVEDLAGVYRKSKVVVVPVFAGAGISMKTLEALGKGKPVVTTPVGARGLSGSNDSFVTLDFEADPRGAAMRIAEFCKSKALRAEYARRAVAFIERNFGSSSYFTRMDELLLPLFGRTSAFGSADESGLLRQDWRRKSRHANVLSELS